jgi:hypothetical protein
MVKMRNGYISVGIPETKRPLGRSRRRWGNNIKTDLTEVEFADADWIHVPQDGVPVQWRAVCEHNNETAIHNRCGVS